jgi:hypothetical protein
MSRDAYWDNKDGLVVGFGTRTVDRHAHKIADNGPTQKLYMDFDWSDLGTSLAATDPQLTQGPVMPSGAVVLSATIKVTEAFAGGTDIDLGTYNSETGAAINAAGIDAAVLTAALTLGAEIACDGAIINTALAADSKLGVISTGTFTAGKAVVEVEYAVPNDG